MIRKNRDPVVHFAVTSHGLGHVTRSLALMRAIHTVEPSWQIVISTTIDPTWIKKQLQFDVTCRNQTYEPGAVQKNCFEVDISGSLKAYDDFQARYDSILSDEIRFLSENTISYVICDIPALPVAAAGHLGVPAIGVSNFTWDWIIEPWCESDDVRLFAMLSDCYSTGTYHFRLPFGPIESSFPESERAPLISRRARVPKAEVRRLLELGDKPVALVCPGGWDADEWPTIHADSGRFDLLTVNSLPISSESSCRNLGHTPPFGLTLPDLVAASDVVLGKPGYGLASECVSHQVPFAMIDRPDFRETPVLVSEMKQMARCSTLLIDQFFSGQWGQILEETIDDEADWTEIDPNAATTLAKRVLEVLSDA